MQKYLLIASITFAAIFLPPHLARRGGLFQPKIAFASSDLIINEIMYDLPAADANHEWIEFYNAGPSEIDLTDYKFNDGSNHELNIPPKNGSRGSIIVPAGGYLILSGNASTTTLDMPNYTGSIIDTVMSLNNTGGALKILNKDGIEISSASYTKEIGAAGNGKTLEWNGTAFNESRADGGTPGNTNSVLSSPPPDNPNPLDSSSSISTPTESVSQDTNSPQSAFNNFSDKIFINEFMPWPAEGKEWVELINSGTETIDLSGWQIDDEPEESAPQIIPSGTIIQPGELRVIELKRNILNNEGDQLRLLWPEGQTVHAVHFQSARQGLSSSRFDDGLWLWTERPTPGAANKKSTPLNPAAPAKASPDITKPPASPNYSNLQASAISSSFHDRTSQKKSASNTLIPLAAIFVLSTAASLGLVYFKRKKSVD